MPVSSRGESPVAMVDRVVTVLAVFGGGEALTSVQVAHRTGVPRSSVHRLLQRLVELGMLEREGFEYRVGLRLFELGSVAPDHHAVRRVALPFMNRLSRATGATVLLGALSGPDVVYIDGIWTEWVGHWRRGVSYPAHLTATGKMLLACLPEDRRPVLASDPACAIRDELREIRERGVAVNTSESASGSLAYSVQIGPLDSAASALTVWGPIAGLQRNEVAHLLRRTGRAIWDASLRGGAAGRQRVTRDGPVRALAGRALHTGGSMRYASGM